MPPDAVWLDSTHVRSDAGGNIGGARPDTVDDAIKAARRDPRTAHIGHRKLHRLCANYMRDGKPEQSFDDWLNFEFYDETGETAVYKIMKAGGRYA